MSLSENLDIKNQRHDNYSGKQDYHDHENGNRDGYSIYPPIKIQYIGYLLRKILSDRKLLLLLILSILILMGLIVLTIIFIIPAIGGLID
jgi:hypothetical protein